MMDKDIATISVWFFIVLAAISFDADTGCTCSGYGVADLDFCIGGIMNLEWNESSLLDVYNDFASILIFIARSARCSYMKSIAKTIPIVQTCPSNFTGDVELRNKCETQNDSIPPVDFMGFFTVTFRNIYCVRCHGVDEDLMVRVTSWITHIKCSEAIKSLKDINANCTSQYDPPRSKLYQCKFVYPRYHSYSIFCPGCESNDTKPNCAFCKFAREDLNVVGFCSKDLKTAIYPFPVQSMERIIINDSLIKGSLACKDDQYLDKYFQICRQFSCPLGYYPKLGQCQNNTTTFMNPNTQPFPDGANLLSVNIEAHIYGPHGFDFVKDVVTQAKITHLNQWIKKISFHNYWRFQSANITLNITDTFLEDFADLFFEIIVLDDPRLLMEFRIFTISENVISCPHESYELRCTDDAEFEFQTDTFLVRLISKNQSVFVALENTHFEIKITHPHSTMELVSVCLCEPSLSVTPFNVTCSTQLYKFTENEYTINTDGSIEIFLTGTKATKSSFYLDSNGTAFVCFGDSPTSLRYFFVYDAMLYYFSLTCTLISLAFLLVTIILFALFSQFRNVSSKITLGLSITMILGQIGLLMPTGKLESCQCIAFVTHFSWLSAFAWMTSQAVDMFVTFYPKTNSKETNWHEGKSFRKYLLACLMIPSIIVCSFFTLDFVPGSHMHSGYGRATCGWLSNPSSYLYGFLTPVCLSVLLNVILLSFVLYYIKKDRLIVTKKSYKTWDRNTIVCFIDMTLSSVMGLSWILAFVASNSNGLWSVYIVLNGLLGFVVFMKFSVKARIRQMIKSKLQGLNTTQSSNRTQIEDNDISTSCTS